MKAKTAKTRVIYNNYDLWENEEAAREYLAENGIENPTDDQIWDELYYEDEMEWDAAKEELENFFDGKTWILVGEAGRWNGSYSVGTIFDDFMKMFYEAARDCDYIKIYDENGHFYLNCSHHDGSNFYEIKQITERGLAYYDNWENNWDDKRTEEYIHNQIMEKYSTLPHFAHKVYGCKKLQYI